MDKSIETQAAPTFIVCLNCGNPLNDLCRKFCNKTCAHKYYYKSYRTNLEYRDKLKSKSKKYYMNISYQEQIKNLSLFKISK